MQLKAALPLLVVAAALLALAPLAAAADGPDFTHDGECAVSASSSVLQLPDSAGCGSSCTLDVVVHLPTPPAGDPGCPEGRFPVVLFFSGFQLSSSFYTPYATRLASWGYAVVQYNLALLTVLADEVEVEFLPHLLQHLQQQPELAGALDFTQVAAAGHSRGAKLAALHFAGPHNISTAFLIDPVDSTAFTPPSPEEPSAVEALRGQGKAAGIAAAGVRGPCNPDGSNHHQFWEVLGPGSWLELVQQAGHMSFAAVHPWLVQRALDLLCHAGDVTHQHVIDLTAPTLVAWMDAHLGAAPSPAVAAAKHAEPSSSSSSSRLWRQLLRGSGGTPATAPSPRQPALDAFWDWVEEEQEAGEISFDIKQ